MIKVMKRTGDVVNFDMENITIALGKCYLAHFGKLTKEIKLEITTITSSIYLEHILPYVKSKSTTNDVVLDIEEIQNYVVCTLIEFGKHKLAEEYSEYRIKQKEFRENYLSKTFTVKKKETGETVSISFERIYNILLNYKKAYFHYFHTELNVDVKDILKQFKNDVYKNMPEEMVMKTLAISAGVFTELGKDYSTLTGIVYSHIVYLDILKEMTTIDKDDIAQCMDKLTSTEVFTNYLNKAASIGLLDKRLLDEERFDFGYLSECIQPHYDFKLGRHGATTLYERYILSDKTNPAQECKLETFQFMYMRIAMGLAIQEDNPSVRAKEFYRVMSQHLYSPSTPTLFNSGLVRPQLSSCYLTTVEDDLGEIFDAYKQDALLSKYAGGIGNDWTNVRSLGSLIKGTNGQSQGVIPFLKVVNDIAVAVNQGGKRKGAICSYLETWHGDIEEFIMLRKETGDDRRRTHDMNTANWIPDLFMKRVLDNAKWTLLSPSDAPDLHGLYGEEFEVKYHEYEQLVIDGKIPGKQVDALSLWRNILSMLFETGHPWIVFKDTCNLLNPQKHVGTIHSSNLCTEITLNTSKEEVAVCNLGSIVLTNHISEATDTSPKMINRSLLEDTIKTAVRMLDNTITVGYYPVPEATNSNMKHRPLGLGYMGMTDLLNEFRIPFDSEEAVLANYHISKLIQENAHYWSGELAVDRGNYSTYPGSKWDIEASGNGPGYNKEIDKTEFAKKNKSIYEKYLYYMNIINSAVDDTPDSESRNVLTKLYGYPSKAPCVKPTYKYMRNSNVTSIAPTATIANIVGVSQSIEPNYKNLYVKSDLCGEFITVNRYLVNDLTKLGLWNKEMINTIKRNDGDIQNIPEIPDDIKRLYKCAHQIDPIWYLFNAAARQGHIDQSQSLNLYISAPSGKLLHETYMLAWLLNLKSTYYLRNEAERTLEKSNSGKACSIEDPTCESCQ